MREKLWCLRLVLLLVVTAVVLSPLAVRGASLSSQPVGWNYDSATLMLPSSPTYPAVVAYRDIRMRIAERSFEKSELLLGFANQDAAAICTMALRQDYVSSSRHSSTYQQTFDRCIGWLVIASERGNDVSYLLARAKNDHLAQQSALSRALEAMPDWSHDGVEAARKHAVEVVLQAIEMLEGSESADSYRDSISLAVPDLDVPQGDVSPPAPSVVVVPPPATAAEATGDTTIETGAGAAPVIASLNADQRTVGFGESVDIECRLASEDDDLLSFTWWCSRGQLVASAGDATWTAPNRVGTCEISVTVSDDAGNRDSRTVKIRVEEDDSGSDGAVDDSEDDSPADTSPAAAPEILSVLATAEHKYLEQSLAGTYAILVARQCTIRCEVENPDGLDFDWVASGGGRITGAGDTVTLAVPASPGHVNVTVTVTNRHGQTDSASLSFYVTTCTYCF